jgi:hypothetical protein
MGLDFIHKKGDTFEAVNFAVIKNAVALNLTGATIKMQLKKECGGIPILSFTSVGSAGLTITNAAGGLFKINKQIINISEYVYLYDIEITFSNGDVKSWVSGEFNVKCDITR